MAANQFCDDAIPIQYGPSRAYEEPFLCMSRYPSMSAQAVARLSSDINWILDSGSGNDIVDIIALTQFPEAVHEIPKQGLNTAGGYTDVNKAVRVCY